MRVRLSSLAKNMSLLLAATNAALADAEAIARLALLDDLGAEATPHEYKFYRFDTRMGWSKSPCRQGEF